jgi:hypothetical protein
VRSIDPKCSGFAALSASESRTVWQLSQYRLGYNEGAMSSQVQVWMPAILAMFGSLMVVVITAWLNTKALSSQIDAVRAEIDVLRAEMKQGFAELRLEFHKEISELSRRVERLEEQRGLVRP